jgi:hypothetical protein
MKVAAMRRVYLREAAVMLVLARLAVRFVTPARLFAWADRPPRSIRRFAADEADWISWAVEERGLNAPSLPRALAAHAMLRRRGIASRLCLGVARDNGEVAARAWVEIGTDKIVGGAGTERFTRLAEFGQVRPSIAMKVP